MTLLFLLARELGAAATTGIPISIIGVSDSLSARVVNDLGLAFQLVGSRNFNVRFFSVVCWFLWTFVTDLLIGAH